MVEYQTTLTKEKVFHTALCIIPPKEIWPQIQVIREKNDSAFKRWPPHINLSFPFVPPNEFPVAKKILENGLKAVQSFKVEFKKFNSFNHGKKSVLWAQPDTIGYILIITCLILLKDNGKELINLEQKIIETLPYLNDLLKKSETGVFAPHLTLGQFSTDSIQAKSKELEQNFNKVEFIVDQISMIQRDGKDTPFYVVDTIQLKP